MKLRLLVFMFIAFLLATLLFLVRNNPNNIFVAGFGGFSILLIFLTYKVLIASSVNRVDNHSHILDFFGKIVIPLIAVLFPYTSEYLSFKQFPSDSGKFPELIAVDSINHEPEEINGRSSSKAKPEIYNKFSNSRELAFYRIDNDKNKANELIGIFSFDNNGIENYEVGYLKESTLNNFISAEPETAIQITKNVFLPDEPIMAYKAIDYDFNDENLGFYLRIHKYINRQTDFIVFNDKGTPEEKTDDEKITEGIISIQDRGAAIFYHPDKGKYYIIMVTEANHDRNVLPEDEWFSQFAYIELDLCQYTLKFK